VDWLLQVGLTNALTATFLALVAAGLGAACRRPALSHALWLLVLLKLLTPPVLSIPISWPAGGRQPPRPVMTGAERPQPAPAFPPSNLPEEPSGSPEPIETARNSMAAEAALAPPASGLTADDPVTAESSAGGGDVDDSQDLPHQADAIGLNWSTPLLTAAWVAGTLCWVALLSVRSWRFRQVVRWGRPAPAEVLARAQEVGVRFGLRRCPEVVFVPGRISPLLGGFFRPQLLLPEELWQRLSTDQRATLLAHELAHVRRQDRWVRLLELAATGLYWWHPVVWWARRELHEAEEQCCDAWVVAALPQAARAYATALVETLDFLAEGPMQLPAAASRIGPIHDLRRRLTMIMRGTTPRSLSAAGFLLVAALGATLLPLVPTWAQQPRPADPAAPQDPLALDREGEQGQRPDNVGQRRAELDRARQDVGRWSEQVRGEKLRLERFQMELRSAQERLAEAQAEAQQQRFSNSGRPGYGGQRPGQASSGEDLSARLDDMDRKLDAVLEELRNLRREMRRAGPGRGLPGGGPGPGAGRFPPAAGAPVPESVPSYPPLPATTAGVPGLGPTPPAAPGNAPLPASAPLPVAPAAPTPAPPPPTSEGESLPPRPASRIPESPPATTPVPPAGKPTSPGSNRI
jgi:beta-lactamase regulating signal transducer with metallopeptidase domain